MCDSSWARTPSSSTRFIFSSSPVVTAMAACFGLRPVAKAFGAGSSMTYTPRLGQAAGDAQPLDEVVQALVLLGSAGLARLTARAIASAFQYETNAIAADDDEGDDDADPAEADDAARRRRR